MNLSELITKVAPSPTLIVTQKAKDMKKRGIDVISFGAGEPDFDTPAPVIEAAKAALDEGLTRYGPVAGIDELREAIVEDIFRKRDVKYNNNQVIVTCGAKSAIFIALEVLLNPGDEVIIPAPYWVSYPDQVILARGTPVIVSTKEENAFKITRGEIEEVLTDRTKVLILNSPSNPTGSIFTKEELKDIIQFCASKNIIIIADEIYDLLVYDDDFVSAISVEPKAIDNIIYINGVSKSYAMTGWRMGYAAGPERLIAAMTKYQGQLLTCIPPFVQKACVAALKLPPETINGMVETFRRRRDMALGIIDEMPRLSCIKPGGAFYIFVNMEKARGKTPSGKTIERSEELAEYLLEEAHVAVVPGIAFGMEGFIRLSFATSEGKIKTGLKRIGEALSKLT